MNFWKAFAPLLLGSAISVACSGSSSPGDTGESTDGSTSPSPSPEPADAGTDDVSVDADAGRPDAAPLKPLEVDCTDTTTCYVAVSGNGGRHMCGLLEDGTVRCWGRDTGEAPVTTDGGVTVGDRALGRGVDVSRLEGATPAEVAGLSNVTQLSVGANLGTCARTSDGAVYCWGRNDSGQLGRRVLSPSDARLTVPTPIAGLPPVDEVALGGSHGCAIASSDRAVYCWGSWIEWMRPLGIPPPTSGPMMVGPQRVTLRGPAKELRIGTVDYTVDTLMVLLEGDVLASAGSSPLTGDSAYTTTGWSEKTAIRRLGTFGYVSDDDFARRWRPVDERLYLPTRAPVIDVKVSSKDGYSNSWQGGVLTMTGRLFRWGPNAAGTLGQSPNDLAEAPYPVEVKQVHDQVISFATTLESTCASLVDGKIKCWGANFYGELGRGAVDFEAHPEPETIQ